MQYELIIYYNALNCMSNTMYFDSNVPNITLNIYAVMEQAIT